MNAQRELISSDWPEPAQPRKRRKESAEELFAFQCAKFRLPVVERQLMFAKSVGRKWRFDFSFREYMIAVEIDGVVVARRGGQLVVMGRHASITGIREDHDKCNTAVMLGWSVLHFLQTDIRNESALRMTQYVLHARGWRP